MSINDRLAALRKEWVTNPARRDAILLEVKVLKLGQETTPVYVPHYHKSEPDITLEEAREALL